MSEKLNFGGVEEASEKAYTPPGTIDVFEITNVEFSSSEKKGTMYMGVTFKRKQDSIDERFYLSEKALKRVKTLVKAATGEVLESELGLEQLKAKLNSKKVAMKVAASQNEESGKWYSNVPFAGFRNAANVGELVFTDAEESAIASYKRYRELAAMENADKPEGVSALAPTAASTDDEPF